jgi:tripartite-type tricarboxylate transporter receptor subunit TctC
VRRSARRRRTSRSSRPTLENMPGAGGLIAANDLYKVAKPDGLTLGHFSDGLVSRTVLYE